MAQKLVATGELVLPEGDIFEVTDKARSARTVLEQAAKEIQKTFPDFKFLFTVGMVRAAGAGTPGRKSAATIAAEKAAAEAAAAAANGKAGAGAGAPAA